jgi:hypothetical protein
MLVDDLPADLGGNIVRRSLAPLIGERRRIEIIANTRAEDGN